MCLEHLIVKFCGLFYLNFLLLNILNTDLTHLSGYLYIKGHEIL